MIIGIVLGVLGLLSFSGVIIYMFCNKEML